MDDTSYYDSAADTVISQARAIHEVNAHGADIQEFFDELGMLPTYHAQTVLQWLGY